MKLFQTLTSKSRFQILPAVSEKIFKEFLISVECKKSPPMAAMFFQGSKFHKQFSKRVTQGTILLYFFKISKVVLEEKNFEEFL